MDDLPLSPFMYFLALAVLLGLSMFFSAAETAFLSASRLHLRYLSEKRHRAARRVEGILSRRDLFLNAILVGNNVVNIAASALITSVSLSLFGDAGVGLATAFATVIILLFGEILPKSVALHWPERLALRISIPVRLAVAASLPVTLPLALLARGISRLGGSGKAAAETGVTEDDLRALIEVGEEEGVIESGKRGMLHRILGYADLCARDVMTPRTNIVAIPEDATLEEILALHARERYSRYPVYGESIDEITGILRIRDLILGLPEPPESLNGSFQVRDWAVKCVFAFESQPLGAVQSLLRSENRNLAVVIDEYGGTAGIVTTEDLAEEVFGGLRDEFDDDEKAASAAGETLVEGTERLTALSERLGIALESECFETIGGLLMERLADIPAVGMSVIEGNWMFTVAEREGNRVVSVRIDRLSGGAE